MLSLGGLGYIGSQSLLLSLGAIIPVALAVKYGNLLRRHVSEKHFRIGVLFVMLLLGLNLVRFT